MTTPDPAAYRTDEGDDQAAGLPPVGAVERRRDQVAAALERIARGEFNRCVVCGTQVDDRRLRIAPETDRCQRHITTPAP